MSVHAILPPRPDVLVAGAVPPRADGFFPRVEPGLDLSPGQTAVLVHGDVTYAAPVSQGGTGKTQLAVAFCHALLDRHAVEVLVWVNAARREAVVSGFAQAADLVDPGPAADDGEGAEAAAVRFVSWLHRTRRPWAMVLDDLADPGDLRELWPAGPAGRVLITTRLPAGAFASSAEDVRFIPVSGLSTAEAMEYLTARLGDGLGPRFQASDLIEDLDGLPLALAQAGAVMRAHGLDCAAYRALLAERRPDMKAVAAVSAPTLAVWSIAVDAARDLPPAGLAWSALALAAMLDHHGVPGAVLTSPAACGYITGRPSTGSDADRHQVRVALGNLARAGLVTLDEPAPAGKPAPGAEPALGTLRMHASVQAAVRAYLPDTDLEQVMLAAANALTEIWAQTDAKHNRDEQLEQALRACAAALRDGDDEVLWKPEAHPLLFRAGLSLERSGLPESAIAYWTSMAATATILLGSAHADAVATRDRLAAAYEAAGRFAEAIEVFRTALTERERNQGPDHPETIAARAHLAHAFASAGRPADAIAAYHVAAAEAARVLGPAHQLTLDARTSLAATCQAADMPDEAIAAHLRLISDAEQNLGASHPATLDARARLAALLARSGRTKEAIAQYRQTLSGLEMVHGPGHPETIAVRAALATAFRTAGQHKDAVAQYERVLADRERAQGAGHVETIAARANLAYAYRSAGRFRAALPHYERTLAERVRIQGADHRDTLIARANLAACYQQARRLPDAIPQYERALADSEQVLGPGDEETLTIRCNLATAYYLAGRLTDVVTMLERALADCREHLGPGHPLTETVQANLDAALP